MELKRYFHPFLFTEPCILIVPYGIETYGSSIELDTDVSF